MSKSFLIYNALCLPAPDIEALIQGRIVAVMPRKWINNPGQPFALYPASISLNSLPLEGYYRSSFLPIVQQVLANFNSKTVVIKAWAKCELCPMPKDPKSLESFSRLSIWTKESLQQMLKQRPYTTLAYLQVYLLPQPIEIPVYTQPRHFVPLPQQLRVFDANPVLTDNIFATRKRQLEKLEPPTHPELEEFLGILSPLALRNPAAKKLEQDIQVFLGWSNKKTANNLDSDLAWIQKIAEVGNSSDGNEFERLVRKSFIKLGFSCSNTNPKANLDPQKLGGAGGVDFYCEYPYPVVGECKATKSEKVPSSTPGQLIQLGKNHLQEKYDPCVKIILAAGELTKDALLTTQNHQMNVITPETLEKLVELQSHYQGCVDLFELKQCLQQEPFGLADDKVNNYINKIKQNIKLRSHIIAAVKELSDQDTESFSVKQKCFTVTEIRTHYNATHNPKLRNELVYHLLIELSSPLTGYLGRIESNEWKNDKFYFLRDLSA